MGGKDRGVTWHTGLGDAPETAELWPCGSCADSRLRKTWYWGHLIHWVKDVKRVEESRKHPQGAVEFC